LSGCGLQIEWRGSGGNIEMELSSDGNYNYLWSEEREGRVETSEADNVPGEEILRFISTIL
jgi:hypothetical protein